MFIFKSRNYHCINQLNKFLEISLSDNLQNYFLFQVKHFDEEQKKNISLHERHNKNDYAFDYFWEQSKKQPNHDDDDDEHHEEEKENA